MADYVFPEARFKEAGATELEITQLRREFNDSDISIQRSQVDFWKPIPNAELGDYVQRLRDAGHFLIDADNVSLLSTQKGLEDDSDDANPSSNENDEGVPDEANLGL